MGERKLKMVYECVYSCNSSLLCSSKTNLSFFLSFGSSDAFCGVGRWMEIDRDERRSIDRSVCAFLVEEGKKIYRSKVFVV